MNSIDVWNWYLIWLEIWMFSSVEFSIRWKSNDEPRQIDVWCEINLTNGRSVTSEIDMPQSMFVFQFFSFSRFVFNLSLFSFSYSTNLIETNQWLQMTLIVMLGKLHVQNAALWVTILLRNTLTNSILCVNNFCAGKIGSKNWWKILKGNWPL